MDVVARISVRHLVNVVAGLPAEIGADPYRRSYVLAISVIRHFLGQDFIESFANPVTGKRGFLQVDLDAPDSQIQLYKAVDLGELLFNLQNIDGFDECIRKLRSGDVEPALAELDVARLLYINNHIFWFVRPTGVLGADFDFMVIYPNGIIASVEAKCNVEAKSINANSIRNSLINGKRQLPKDGPGILAVKLPTQWLTENAFSQDSIKVANDFLRTTERVVSIKYYSSPYVFEDQDHTMAQTPAFVEINNPKTRFNITMDWNLFQSWKPKHDSWNSMPPQWTRLLYFPVREMPA
jgi:hypothetical protein